MRDIHPEYITQERPFLKTIRPSSFLVLFILHPTPSPTPPPSPPGRRRFSCLPSLHRSPRVPTWGRRASLFPSERASEPARNTQKEEEKECVRVCERKREGETEQDWNHTLGRADMAPAFDSSLSPVHLSVPNGVHSRVLHDQSPGYVAPTFEGKEKQMEQGE